MVSVTSQGGKISPTLLDRTVCSKISNQEEKKFLHVTWQLLQPTCNLSLDPNLIFHPGNNITLRSNEASNIQILNMAVQGKHPLFMEEDKAQVWLHHGILC